MALGLVRDDWSDPTFATGGAIGLAVVALIPHRGERLDVRAKIEQRLKVRRVGFLAFGQIEGDRTAVEMGLEMDFRREATVRAAEGLALLPPFAPAAETCARTTVESNICTR